MNVNGEILDIHTHRLSRISNAIVNLRPDEVVQAAAIHPQALFSTGIHPWNSGEATTNDIATLRMAARLPQVAAIGETGLDSLRGAPLDRQIELLRLHASLSETLGKPLIIHLVKHLDALLSEHRSLSPSQPWIIHGFRGKPTQARTLLNAGFLLSLGPRFNPETARYVPADRLLAETDDSTTDITDVIASIAAARNLPAVLLSETIARNIRAVLAIV